MASEEIIDDNDINGVVYRLFCQDPNIVDCYIGSTMNLKIRKRQHKQACHYEGHKLHNVPLYRRMRETGGFSNWKFEVLEDNRYPSRTELRAAERKFYEETENTLNVYHPKRTPAERYQDQREQILARVNAYNAQRREYQAARQKAHYWANKDRVLAKAKERVTCECGCEMNRGSLYTHRLSPKHLRLMSEITSAPVVSDGP